MVARMSRVDDLVSVELRQRLVGTMKRVDGTSLVSANQGNLSARDPRTGNIVITPTSFPYNLMTVDDLVIIDASGRRIGGNREPSSDSVVHLTVYAQRPDVDAVLHTEPPHVNALGALGRDIVPVTTTGLVSGNGTVPIMAFRPTRSESFAIEMLEVMGNSYGVVWQNHGLLAIGNSPEQAADRSVCIEFNAQVLLLAMSVGEPQTLESVDPSTIMA